MSWLKSSDQSHSHPVVFQAAEHPKADDRTVNELFGCMARCAAYVASFEGDYVIRMGSFKMIAGMSRWAQLEDQAVAAGYADRVHLEDGTPALKLVQDEELFNMIPRSAREWANQRKADTRNKSLVIPVRVRDGDGCRYCGDPVIWGDQKSGRGGTYDHLRPGEAGTVETFVVACRSCNGSRQDDRPAFDKEHPLLPEPVKPYYSQSTAQWLARNGVHVEPTDGSRKTTPADEQASGQANGTAAAAHSDSAPTKVEHTEQRPAAVPDPEPSTATARQQETDPADSSESRPIEGVPDPGMSGRDQGRAGDGPGRAEQGEAGRPISGEGQDHPRPQHDPAQVSPDQQGKKRKRRRKRKR